MTSINIFNKILDFANENEASDIHLNSEHKPIIRDKSWYIKFIDEQDELSNDLITEIILEISWQEWYDKFINNMELDLSYSYKESRYRVNFYIDTSWYSIALRLIPNKIPTLEDLNLWDYAKQMCDKQKWLILVTWPTWSWKSTNLAAMINYINKKYSKHIITIEDPVEFSFKSDKSLINQREIWNNTKWFPEAIRASLREDPDVIMIWEMRDPETISAALTLAETWHLVLSTLHTNDSVQTIDRIVDVFPSNQQKQIRMQLSMSLVWIISQRLLPKKDEEWKIAAREILLTNDAVRNLIVTWKSFQIYWIIEISQKEWMILMDKYLIWLYWKWIISRDVLISYSRDKESIKMLTN